jgi:hypothetical protein
MQIGNSPHGVVSPLPDPVRHGAILLQLLAQLALDDKRLVGTLQPCRVKFEWSSFSWMYMHMMGNNASECVNKR